MSPGRVLLALETSSPAASVAVGVGGELRAVGWLTRPREHGAGLVARIESTLGEAGVGRGELDGVVCGRGPGSFTGIRIGAATAMGLAKGLDVPLYPRSSLKAAALTVEGPVPASLLEAGSWLDASGADPAAPRYVLFDARSDRVYAACYRVLAERIVTIVEPRASTIGEVLEGPLPTGARFCGDGALRSAALILGAGYTLLPPPLRVPDGRRAPLPRRPVRRGASGPPGVRARVPACPRCLPGRLRSGPGPGMKGPRGGGEGGLGVRGPRGWKLRGIGALEAVVFRAPWMAGARRRCRRRTGGEDRVVLRLPLAGPRVGPGG